MQRFYIGKNDRERALRHETPFKLKPGVITRRKPKTAAAFLIFMLLSSKL
jgi:hypothetical protein